MRRNTQHLHDAKLGKKVRKRIAAKGLNVSTAATAAGLERTVLTRTLSGTRPWTRDAIERLALVLGTKFDDLVAGTPSKAAFAATAETVPRAEFDHLRLEYLKAIDEVAELRRELRRAMADGAGALARHKRHTRSVDARLARALHGIGHLIVDLPVTTAALRDITKKRTP